MNDALMKLDERVRELEALVFSHLTLEKRYKEPLRPRDGMIAYADGTHWNPGCGKGLYHFRDGHWYRLMVDCEPSWVNLLSSALWEVDFCGALEWDNETLYSATGGSGALTWLGPNGFQEPEWEAVKVDYVYEEPTTQDLNIYGARLYIDAWDDQTEWNAQLLDDSLNTVLPAGTQQVSIITYRSADAWPTAANTGALWGNLSASFYPSAMHEAVRITGIWVKYK